MSKNLKQMFHINLPLTKIFAFLLVVNFGHTMILANTEPVDPTQNLKELEAIIAPYETLEDFLSDPEAIERYQLLIEHYMGYGDRFHEIFQEWVIQLKEICGTLPELAHQLWQYDSQWQNRTIRLAGNIAISGLQIKKSSLKETLTTLQRQLHQETSGFDFKQIRKRSRLNELARSLLTKHQLPHNLQPLSRRQQRLLNSNIAKLKKDDQYQYLTKIIAMILLSEHREVPKAINTLNADFIVYALKRLKKPSHFIEFLKNYLTLEDQDPLIALLPYLKFESTLIESILKEYQNGLVSMGQFQSIPIPRLPAKLHEKVIQLINTGVPLKRMAGHLKHDERLIFFSWQQAVKDHIDQKLAIQKSYNEMNPYFFYEATNDPHKMTLRLKNWGATQLILVSTPRPFHAVFAGHKKQECVGGQNCSDLTPRRWGRFGLKGSHVFFVQKPNGHMEGYLSFLPITQDQKNFYYTLDIMSHSIQQHTLTTGHHGQLINYSFLDLALERLGKLLDAPIVLSDSESIKSNTSALATVLQSPAYQLGEPLGLSTEFFPTDYELAQKIAHYYPYGEYEGGLIYDGMSQRPAQIYRLPLYRERQKVIQTQTELIILSELDKNNGVINNDSALSKLLHEAQMEYRDIPSLNKAIHEALINHPGSKLAKKALEILTDIAGNSKRAYLVTVTPELVNALEFHMTHYTGTSIAALTLQALLMLLEQYDHHDFLFDEKTIKAVLLNLTQFHESPASQWAAWCLMLYLDKRPYLAKILNDNITEHLTMILLEYPGTNTAMAAAELLSKTLSLWPENTNIITPRLLKAFEIHFVKHSTTEATECVRKAFLTTVSYNVTNSELHEFINQLLDHEPESLAVKIAQQALDLLEVHQQPREDDQQDPNIKPTPKTEGAPTDNRSEPKTLGSRCARNF